MSLRERYRGDDHGRPQGLKFVGFIFATVTMAVMLTTAMVVKTYADGVYTIENTSFASE